MAKYKFYSWKFRFTLLFLFSLVVLYFNLRAVKDISSTPEFKNKCDINAAKYLIENLCDLYLNQKVVIGSMCSSLCNPSNRFKYFEDYELVDCLNKQPAGLMQNRLSEIYDGFKVVLVYEHKNKAAAAASNKPQRFVLKSRHKSFLDFDTHIDFDFKEKSIGQQLKYLINYIRTTLMSNYDIRMDKDAIVWLKNFVKNPQMSLKSFQNENLNKKDLIYYVKLFAVNNFDYFERAITTNDRHSLATFITNLIVLIYQEEYLFYRYFQSKPNSLKIYGSCGHLYAVEYARSLSSQIADMKFDDRKSLAIQFLSLVHNLDTIYLSNVKKSKTKKLDEELESDDLENEDLTTYDSSNSTKKLVTIPMQMCDVKMDNFGLNDQGKLKIIDTDMIHPDSYLFNEKVCAKHDDCHFFDCKSFCDPNTKHCILTRVNNNLQTLCEKVFDNPYVKDEALLMGAEDKFGSNLHDELKRRIEMCKSPGFYHNSNIPISANNTLISVFNVLLSDKGINN